MFYWKCFRETETEFNVSKKMQAESRREQCLLWVIHTYIFSLSMIKNRRISLFGTSSSVQSKTIKIIHSMKCRRSGTYKIKWNIKLKVYTPCHFLREPSSSGVESCSSEIGGIKRLPNKRFWTRCQKTMYCVCGFWFCGNENFERHESIL